MITRHAAAAIVLGCVLAAGATAASPAVTVSPGAEDRLAEIEGRCPTFIWGAEEGAVAHEIVVYRIRDQRVLNDLSSVNLDACEEVLYRRVPGGASAWQPELAEALVPGAAYVWFVRAVIDDDAELTQTGAWTEPRFFSVSDVVSERELEHSLEVVRRYLEQNPGQEARLGTHSAERAENANDRPARAEDDGASSAGSKSVPTATAAIRGSIPDPTGEVYGVIGLSASPDGAGVAAANSGGGPDLVLDGSENGTADTELSESGINRPSATAQVFSIGNTGGGGMTLQVDGAGVLTTASAIDADTLDGIDGADYATDAEAAGMIAVHAGSADHDGRYFTETELGASGAAAVHWDNLSSVPAGFADGVDNDTTYSIGGGLVLENGEVRIDPAAFTTRVSSLDSVGYGGGYASIAIGTDGLGLISYYDFTNGDLKVAHCNDVVCTTATTAIIDSSGDVGEYPSIAIGSDGLGLISYRDVTNGLKVAHCNDPVCSSATIVVLDGAATVGSSSSIVIGSDGLGLISYSSNDWDLKVAHCDNISCTSATTSVLDSDGYVGLRTSIALGGDNLGLVAYLDASNFTVKVAHCSNVDCTSATTAAVDTPVFSTLFQPSVTVGIDGLGLISFYDEIDGALRIAKCQNVSCSASSVTVVDREGNAGIVSSLTIGVDGLGVMSYTSDNSLKIARCNDPSCTNFSTAELFHGEGGDNSIAIGADGLGLISFCGVNGDLRVAHLGVGVP